MYKIIFYGLCYGKMGAPYNKGHLLELPKIMGPSKMKFLFFAVQVLTTRGLSISTCFERATIPAYPLNCVLYSSGDTSIKSHGSRFLDNLTA